MAATRGYGGWRRPVATGDGGDLWPRGVRRAGLRGIAVRGKTRRYRQVASLRGMSRPQRNGDGRGGFPRGGRNGSRFGLPSARGRSTTHPP
jgi:hypothetical protein